MDIARLAQKPQLIAGQSVSVRSQVEDVKRERVLELGCGFNKRPGAYGVDYTGPRPADVPEAASESLD